MKQLDKLEFVALYKYEVDKKMKYVINNKKILLYTTILSVIICIILVVYFFINPVMVIDDQLAVFIDCEIASHNQSEKSANNFCCLDWKVIGKEKADNQTTLYMWVLYEEFSNENQLTVESSAHTFSVITAEQQDGQYDLVEYWEAEDGGCFTDSIKAKVPKQLWIKALNPQLYIDKQSKTIEKCARKYF